MKNIKNILTLFLAPSSFPRIPAAITTPIIPVYSAAPIKQPTPYRFPRINIFREAQLNQVKNEKIEKKLQNKAS